ncbi:hypothetical protein Y032_0193g1406 [Ancylostoma ceylanicum]|uniref:Uncharacterized protein n=1 Tax=Ancylostoma ceylanicum TaxID=53326 RepID=A0A016SQ84_9BILA|nr:hypothetical protein Y032_0193g1406 [Ancylostoma ceylanicum]
MEAKNYDRFSTPENVNTTQSSILAIQDLNQRYGFILYDKNARSTAPLKALDAIAQLTSIKPYSGRAFNQSLAIRKFARQSTAKDKLVYYFPCEYDYSEDKDRELFLEVMDQFGLRGRILLVSHTHSAEFVAKAYRQSQQNVVGDGMNIVERIQSFGRNHTESTATSISDSSSTTSRPTTSTSRSTSDLNRTSRLTTTTHERNDTAAAPTSTPALSTIEPAKSGSHCLFAGDLLNFGNESAAYENETKFIVNIGKKLFNSTRDVSAGIWAYGYTNYSSVTIGNDTMRSSLEEFSQDVDATMQLQDEIKIYNKRVLATLNSCNDTYRHANCLVFFSGLNSTLVWKNFYDDRYFKLNVTRNARIKRVVAVSLESVDFSKIVIPPDGVAVKASQNYTDDEASKVVEAILGKPVED